VGDQPVRQLTPMALMILMQEFDLHRGHIDTGWTLAFAPLA
jgi:hypothetical protein